MEVKMKKVLKIVSVVLVSVILLVLLVACGFSVFDRISYWSFYRNSERAFAIPGLWDGAVQQGFDYSEELELYIYSGYMKDGSASRLYIIDEDGDDRFVQLYEKDGSDHTGHVGGVSFGGEYVYVTASSKDKILMFELVDVLDGDGKATVYDDFEVCVSSAYVYVRNNTLYTGEFYYLPSYDTPEEHWLTTPAGDEHKAIMGVYELGEDGKPEDTTPEYVISTRDKVQGMAFDSQGRLILSTSWGLGASEICVYDLDEAKNGTMALNGADVRVMYADSSCLDYSIETAPMAEELVYKDGKLLIMNESASMKYLFGKLTSGNHVRAFNYDDCVAA